MGMLRSVTGRTANRTPAMYSERDLICVPVDKSRRWPSTVESTRDVAYWREIQEDDEAQEALREVGLA